MNRRTAAQLLASFPFAGLALPAAFQRPQRPERARVQAEAVEHPRIAAAITSIQDAIEYMQHAPHDFGGHRAAAVQASRAAVEQLRLALAYRAAQDHKPR